MHSSIKVITAIASLCAMVLASAATFTYHGDLHDGGRPAEGSYDLELTLYPAANGGSAIAGPLVLYAVPVHGGSFSAEADFGALPNVHGDAWVAVRVRPAGSDAFSALSTRAAVSATTSSVCPGAWTLGGNAGNPAGSFLGTADAQPLIFKVNSSSVGSITPSGDEMTYPNAPNVVLGSSGNVVGTGANAVGATVSGGGSTLDCGGSGPCINSATMPFATVAGGSSNLAIGDRATVSGGEFNVAGGASSTVSGGRANIASGEFATVVGGLGNYASGAFAVAAGAYNQAEGDSSFTGGYRAETRAGAPGCMSNCGDYGTFVWSDVQNSSFQSTAPNQFLIRAHGNVGINTNAPKTPMHLSDGTSAGAPFTPVPGTLATFESSGPAYLSVMTPAAAQNGILFGNPASPGAGAVIYRSFGTSGMYFNTNGGTNLLLTSTGQLEIGPGVSPVAGHLIDTSANGAFLTTGGTWTNGSSRTFKEAFAAVDVGDVLAKVLALPVQTWFYRNDHLEGRHMGPMAEDFAQAFGLGADDTHVSTVDESGVAFAAIQGLYEKVSTDNASLKQQSEALARENASLRANVADLQGKLDGVVARLGKLEGAQGE